MKYWIYELKAWWQELPGPERIVALIIVWSFVFLAGQILRAAL